MYLCLFEGACVCCVHACVHEHVKNLRDLFIPQGLVWFSQERACCDSWAIYTTAPAAQFRLGAGCCVYICDLDQTWIRRLTSLLLHIYHLGLWSRQQMTHSGMQAALTPTLGPSWAWLTSILGWLGCIQPRKFCSCVCECTCAFLLYVTVPVIFPKTVCMCVHFSGLFRMADGTVLHLCGTGRCWNVFFPLVL